MTEELSKPCCTPNAPAAAFQPRPVQPSAKPKDQSAVPIPGGLALCGTSRPGIADDGEGPLRKRKIKPFRMAATTVTNAEFAAFVEETGYVTEAEHIGWSFVFWSDVPGDLEDTRPVPGIEWWRQVFGATWRAPNGPGTEAAAKPDHPVVQVSWIDAQSYATWAGGRLPTEAEWEHAARGGFGDVPFPWGMEEPDDLAVLPCNIWQGQFPNHNTGADGHMATAPAQSFEPNGFGLFNMVGNVWEWTSDPYRIKSLKKSVKQKLQAMPGFKLSKGGSFLCHKSYCYRYRIAARSGTSPDSATPHHGFRLVFPE